LATVARPDVLRTLAHRADQDVSSILQDCALVEPFIQPAANVILESGWDPLASLENTFVPFTTPLEPGWSTTGCTPVASQLTR
jgi:hypothetical protein